MLPELKSLGYTGNMPLLFPRRPLALPAMLTSCGYSKETSRNYDWGGLERGTGEFCLAQYTIAGRGLLEYEGHRHEVKPGQMMLLHFPHDNRYRLPEDAQGWEFLYVCVCGRFMLQCWRNILQRHGPLIPFTESSRPVQHMNTIVRQVAHGQVDSPFTGSSLAYELAMTLLVETEQNEPGQSDLRPGWVERVRDYATVHFCENIGVDDLAAVSRLSRYHFSRQFRRWTGQAPGEYIQSLRLREAVRLLTETDWNIAETAIRCGYADANYFCRTFHKHFGISPAAFRKSGMYHSGD